MLATQTPLAAQAARPCASRSTGALATGVTAKDVILAIIAHDRRRAAASVTSSSTRARRSAAMSMDEPHDRLQHVDRGGRARRHDRARRDDLRVPRGPAVRAARRSLGAGARVLARAAPSDARRASSIARSRSTRRDIAADGHLGHQPRRTRCRSAGACPTRRRSPTPGARGMRRALWPTWASRPATPLTRSPVDSRVHRLVHQQPASRTCARRPRVVARGAARWCRRGSCPAPGWSSARREAEGLDRVFLDAGFEWREAGLLDVRRHERRHGRPGRARARPRRTATSRAARARARRTHLMRRPMAAAAAVTGRLTDVRTLGV